MCGPSSERAHDLLIVSLDALATYPGMLATDAYFLRGICGEFPVPLSPWAVRPKRILFRWRHRL